MSTRPRARVGGGSTESWMFTDSRGLYGGNGSEHTNGPSRGRSCRYSGPPSPLRGYGETALAPVQRGGQQTFARIRPFGRAFPILWKSGAGR
jgi:hypothetical protein